MWKFQLFATTLIVLLALFIPDFWREWGELPFLISGFLTVGLLHGSADLLLIRQFGMAENGPGTAYWLAAYLGLIGFVAILLLLAPQVALIGFLIISMFHFGESQFWGPRLARSRSLQLERHALQWIWGAWVILAPIVMHPKESIGVLRSLGEFPDVI
jgi:Brp/Blh family beta-carotene 15,15'-monooxygenase